MYETIRFIAAGRFARIVLDWLSRAEALPRWILVHDPIAATVETLCSWVSGIEPAIRTTPGNRLCAIHTKLRSQS